MKCAVIHLSINSKYAGIYKDFDSAALACAPIMTAKDKRNIRPLLETKDSMNSNGRIFNSDALTFISLEDK